MNQIDGKTATCGLIGNPVEHTVSPAIHNTLSGLLHRNMVYVPFLVEEGGLETAVRGAYALHIKGMNVTVPYKTDVIPFLQGMDSLAERIGAVNTLVRVEGGYKGYNTDMQGLYRAMQSEGIALEQEDVIVLGAGGAARAVCFMCAFHNTRRIYLINRTVEKAQSIAEEVNGYLDRELVMPMSLSSWDALPRRKMLAIQTTSVGLFPDDRHAVIEESAFYERVHTGFDLIYRPLHTKFMKLVEEHGGRAYHGLKMLLYQGIIAYELWNDIQVPAEYDDMVYAQMKKAMDIPRETPKA